VRLLVKVAGLLAEDIMVFGQAPCSAGRMKRRNVAYLGLLPAPQNGWSDITDIYIARYGEPRAGEKIFIVTRQQKDGWEGDDLETNEIVPEKPAGQQAVGTAALTLLPHMHKGCTRGAQGVDKGVIPKWCRWCGRVAGQGCRAGRLEWRRWLGRRGIANCQWQIANHIANGQ
jgi:hypothetical protein